MGFTSVHGSITAALVATTASVVGSYSKVRVANAGVAPFYFRLDGTAANAGATSALCATTADGLNVWEFQVVPASAPTPPSVTTTVSLFSATTNAAYSITGY